MSSYDVGNKIRVTVTFTDILNDSGVVDPNTVYCSIRTPSNKTVTYENDVDTEVVKSSTGIYYIDVPLSTDGHWYIRWWGLDADGAASASEEVQIECLPHQAD